MRKFSKAVAGSVASAFSVALANVLQESVGHAERVWGPESPFVLLFGAVVGFVVPYFAPRNTE